MAFERLAMYLLGVVLLMGVLPIYSIGAEYFHSGGHRPLLLLVGKWFVFWSAGIRLFTAGLRQLLQPQFTIEKIFGITSKDALPFVRELGMANLAIGTVGIASLAKPGFVLPVAIAAAIFYSLAGIRHATDRGRKRNRNAARNVARKVAMISDLFVALIFLAFVASTALA